MEQQPLPRNKGSDRIQINNLLAAVCVAALALLLTSTQFKPSQWSVVQFALAIPVLVSSSLAYAKTTYRDVSEYRLWDFFGWCCHSLGYIMLLNAMVIFLNQASDPLVAWIFLGVIVLVYVLYSTIDVAAKRSRLLEKSLKLGFYLFLIGLGSVLPLVCGWASVNNPTR